MNLSKKKGFTLVEVLIAVSIIMIFIIPSINIFMSALQNNISSGEKSQLVRAGETIMERIKAGEGYVKGIEKSFVPAEYDKNIKYNIEEFDYVFNDSTFKKIILKIYWENSSDEYISFTTLKR